ncbi:hypothetical protein [Acidiphilium acidophilum]|uniref:Uncharacterized protein n=1 Tax=Acidiphilium acidophilum TaxID=76588 RepID=A0AAW9DUY4_ACIAO|nr:hypothetical protein [Acidiphilium acidophilum]MDX5932919.1 hypothetical protein [Acidiphilium acidophilum]
MSDLPPSAINKPSAARRWRRMAENALLLPVALVLEVLDRVIWDGAKALLNLISRLTLVARLRRFLQTLPPIIVVFLFLIPEAIDHLSGLWATVLFVKGHWFAATIVAVFIKGFAILLALWIYQACEANLLSVAWFRTAHDTVIRTRDWVLERTRPIRERLHLAARNGERSRLGRRLAAWRQRIGRSWVR